MVRKNVEKKNSSYARGRRIEYRVARELRSRGFTVTRAAGSHSPCDIIAYNHSWCLHIQVKARVTKNEAKKILRDMTQMIPRECVAYLATRAGRKIILMTEEAREHTHRGTYPPLTAIKTGTIIAKSVSE